MNKNDMSAYYDKYVQGIIKSRVYDVVERKTPVVRGHFISKRFSNNIWLKREDMLPVFSFKLRGAYNCIAQLSEEQRQAGVVTASAGNHAQGVAFSGAKLGISAKIVMPVTTPSIKVESVRERGGEVVLFGDTFNEALQEALRIAEIEKRAFIHPYDDEHVITGQGTVALEILRQFKEPLDAVFVPVGGGGLLAGVALFIKTQRPEIRVYAVESEESACLAAAMKDGPQARLKHVGIFADGVAVAQIGKLPYELIHHLIDGYITVSNDEICAAVRDVFEDTRTVPEPSGALSLAGLKKHVEETGCRDENLLCVVSGANVDFSKLKFIAERAEVGEKREGIFSIRIPEGSGSLQSFLDVIATQDISEFAYRYAGAGLADVLLGIRFRDPSNHEKIVTDIAAKGYEVDDFTHDEITKTHIMYMVGGHLPVNAPNEYLFQVYFPERPGALAKFLEVMHARWNISLFHYRNLGTLDGQVLIAFQCPEPEFEALIAFLDQVEYTYEHVSDNSAYLQFLSRHTD